MTGLRSTNGQLRNSHGDESTARGRETIIVQLRMVPGGRWTNWGNRFVDCMDV